MMLRGTQRCDRRTPAIRAIASAGVEQPLRSQQVPITTNGAQKKVARILGVMISSCDSPTLHLRALSRAQAL